MDSENVTSSHPPEATSRTTADQVIQEPIHGHGARLESLSIDKDNGAPKASSSSKHWSWSSWLMGAPPLPPENELELTVEEQSLTRTVVDSEKEVGQEAGGSGSSWIWDGAAQLLSAAGKSAAYVTNNIASGGTLNQEVASEEATASPSAEAVPSSGESGTPSLTTSLSMSGLSSRLWNRNLWSDMKRDLSEFAHTMQNDTAQLVNSTKAGMRASAHLKETLHKLGDSHLARKMADWSEKTLATVSTYVLTEEELRGEAQGDEDRFMPISALSSSTRVQNQLHSLLQQPSKLFSQPPSPTEQYESWVASLAPLSKEEFVESQSGVLGPLLLEYEGVRREYARLVPGEMSHEEFFLRYLYHVHRLEKEEQRREDLRHRAEKAAATHNTETKSDEEEGWGSDEEEVKEVTSATPEPPSQTPTQRETSQIVLVERAGEDMVMVRHTASITSGVSNVTTSNETDFSSLHATPAMSPANRSATSSADGSHELVTSNVTAAGAHQQQDNSGWDDDFMNEPLTEEEKKLVEEFEANKGSPKKDEEQTTDEQPINNQQEDTTETAPKAVKKEDENDWIDWS